MKEYLDSRIDAAGTAADIGIRTLDQKSCMINQPKGATPPALTSQDGIGPLYHPHPSTQLNDLFLRRPYQATSPPDTRFLFIGLDANYSPDIESSPIYSELLSYHDDGAAFWRRTGVHHPFLLEQYRGDGRKYHKNFARLGFRPQHAHLVSFVELLQLPSVGRSSLSAADLDPAHLRFIDDAIRRGRAEHVFVSSAVWRLMRKSDVFSWLPPQRSIEEILPRIYASSGRTIYLHLHFSNYGKFEKRMLAEAAAINALIPKDDASPVR